MLEWVLHAASASDQVCYVVAGSADQYGRHICALNPNGIHLTMLDAVLHAASIVVTAMRGSAMRFGRTQVQHGLSIADHLVEVCETHNGRLW
jgi:hypothetical protein